MVVGGASQQDRRMANEELPPAPDSDPRFDVLPEDYPGGAKAYDHDYIRALEWRDREQHRIGLGLTEEEYLQRERYFKLRTQVSKMVEKLAQETGHDGRTISLWLVKGHGFPWRDDCEYSDLKRMKKFLADPANRSEAHFIEPATPRRRP